MPANASSRGAAVGARSGATGRLAPVQQLVGGARDVGLEPIWIAIRGDDDHAALVRARDLEVALAHAAVEVQLALLERVELTAPDPADADGGIQVENDREVGLD